MPFQEGRPIENHHDTAGLHKKMNPSVPEQIRYVWQLSELLSAQVGPCIPRGVRKYRSIEEANADREHWERERVQRIREMWSSKP